MANDKKTILVVDDDPDVVEAAKVVLESAGYNVESAGDGETGVRLAQEIRPSLIILDVMMGKETEGFHSSYQLKNDPATASIPILMVSAISEKTGMDFSPEKDGDYLPVNEFLAKPVEPQELISRVKHLLGDE